MYIILGPIKEKRGWEKEPPHTTNMLTKKKT